MWSNPTTTLGKFWMDDLNIPEGEIIVITGINRQDPSLHSISTWLRNPIYLANELGLFIEATPGNFTSNFQEISFPSNKQQLWLRGYRYLRF